MYGEPDNSTTHVCSANPLWTTDDVATYLRVPKKTLYEWRVKSYGPEGRRVGKYVRYDPEVVRAWFQAQSAA